MSGPDVYSDTMIPAGDWSSDVVYTQGAVTVRSLDTGAASLSGTVSHAGDPVVVTVTAPGGGQFQEELQAVCDIDGGSLFADAGGGHFLFSNTALIVGRSYAALPDFGAFECGSGTPACFAEHTLIDTDHGPVPVEALRLGDRVRTHRRPGFAPIVWIGRRHVVCARHRTHDVWPVRVAAGAIAPLRPLRDVYLSPEHALFLDGALVPVRHLLNDATIVQVPTDRITYWHVELAEHDVLLAEGLPVESFLDVGNRVSFAGSHAVAASTAPASGASPRRACAPRLDDPARQADLRLRLRERAASLGYRETEDAGLTLRADGRPLPASWDGRRIEAVLPAALRMVHLHSHTAVPSQQRAGCSDHRRLGVAVAAIRFDEVAIAFDDGRLLAGWHPPEPNLRWTDGMASLVLPPSRQPIRLTIDTAPMLRYWQSGLAVSMALEAASRLAA